VAVVSWFAGLLYIVRLFIYHVEAAARPEAERAVLQAQFAIMERRLWYGNHLAAFIATAVFGIWLMILVRAYGPTGSTSSSACWPADRVPIFIAERSAKTWPRRLPSHLKQLRIWNEAATLLLFRHRVSRRC